MASKLVLVNLFVDGIFSGKILVFSGEENFSLQSTSCEVAITSSFNVCATRMSASYSTLTQMNTVELCRPVSGLLPDPVLIYKVFPSMLNWLI